LGPSLNQPFCRNQLTGSRGARTSDQTFAGIDLPSALDIRARKRLVGMLDDGIAWGEGPVAKLTVRAIETV